MAPAPAPDTGFHSRRARSALIALLAIAFVLCTAWLDGGDGMLPATLFVHPDWIPWWSTPLRMLCNALPGLLLAFA